MTTTYPLPDIPVPEQDFERVWDDPPGLLGVLSGVQNGPIGMRFIATSFLFFVLAGVVSLLMRVQLAVPQSTFLDPETYNRLFTVHGTTMIFLFTVPLIEGITALVLPQMLGARELPFPRLTAFSYWAFLFGGLIFYAGFLFNDVPDAGWFAYVPLSNTEFSPGRGMDFWLLGLSAAEIGAISGAFEFIISFFKIRAPGMSLNRIPIFAWAMVVTGFMMIFGFTPLVVGSLMLETDRALGTNFFRPQMGGSVLLWQHIFWIFGHPDVYIQFIPAAGMVSMIVPVFARRRLIGHNLVVASLVTTGFLSFGLWVHHMFTTGLPELSLSFFTAASVLVAIPTGVQVFAWIATIWSGKPVFTTAFLFVIGFFIIFVLGGLTGVMVANIPFDLQAHDSYFVVAHFHYVIFGGLVFPAFAAFYYWGPKYLGRMFDERLGKWHFWLVFIGFNLTFFPQHIAGLLGMPRRVYTYEAGLGWDGYNLASTIGAFVLGAGILVFIINALRTFRSGKPAPDNPWNAGTLEWATHTPTPQYGFRRLPIVRSRYPLWDQDDLRTGEPHTVALTEGLAHYPIHWRAQVVASSLEAQPQEVFRVAGTSAWPLVTAAGLMLASFFLIFSLTAPAVISVVIMFIGIIGWHSRDAGEELRDPPRDEQFERTHNIPVRLEGSRGVTRGAMLLTIATLLTALLTLIFSYLYLRLDQPQWPPAGIPEPSLPLPAVTLVLLLIGSVAMVWASRGVHRNTWTPVRAGLALAVVLGLVYVGLTAADLTRVNFTLQTNAYGSLYFLISAFQILTVVIGLVASAVTLFWSFRTRNASEQYPVTALALFWGYLALSSTIVFVTLYVLPHVF